MNSKEIAEQERKEKIKVLKEMTKEMNKLRSEIREYDKFLGLTKKRKKNDTITDRTD